MNICAFINRYKKPNIKSMYLTKQALAQELADNLKSALFPLV